MTSSRSLVVAAGLVAGLGLATPASATATLTCDFESRDVVFHVQAAVGHEALTLSGLVGELKLPRRGISAEIGGADLMQTWIEGEDLRLRFHVFGEGDRPDLDLTIVTRRKTETDHVGRYRLRIGEGERAPLLRGPITCVVG